MVWLDKSQTLTSASDEPSTGPPIQTTIDDINRTPENKHKVFRDIHRSPMSLTKKATFTDLQQVNAGIHLWCERRKGGVMYMMKNRLTDEDFMDVLEFVGPDSDFNMIGPYTASQLKGLWRNSRGLKDPYRGHHLTGFENENHLHVASELYCPFHFCSNGLSPNIYTLPVIAASKKILPPKKLSFEKAIPSSPYLKKDSIPCSSKNETLSGISLEGEAPPETSFSETESEVIACSDSVPVPSIILGSEVATLSSPHPNEVSLQYSSKNETLRGISLEVDSRPGTYFTETENDVVTVTALSEICPKIALFKEATLSSFLKNDTLSGTSQSGTSFTEPKSDVFTVVAQSEISLSPKNLLLEEVILSSPYPEKVSLPCSSKNEPISGISLEVEAWSGTSFAETGSSVLPVIARSEVSPKKFLSKEANHLSPYPEIISLSCNSSKNETFSGSSLEREAQPGPSLTQPESDVFVSEDAATIFEGEYNPILSVPVQYGISLLTEEKHFDQRQQMEGGKFVIPDVPCSEPNCHKKFATARGLEKHMHDYHPDNKVRVSMQCTICRKWFHYLSEHMNDAHSELVVKKSKTCNVCKTTFEKNSEYNEHRKKCIKCLNKPCIHENPRPDRLIHHMENLCKFRNVHQAMEEIETEGPLDLRSPLKIKDQSVSAAGDQSVSAAVGYQSAFEAGGDESENDIDPVNRALSDLHVDCDSVDMDFRMEDFEKVRQKYPFDLDNGEEMYFSEYEETDSREFTKLRRKNKDQVERQLRVIDSMKNPYEEGDCLVLEGFGEFMRLGADKDQVEKGTVKMYTRIVKNDILKSLHDMYPEMDARDLITKGRNKQYLVENNQDTHFNPRDPLLFSVDLVQVIMKKYETGAFGGSHKIALAALRRFMGFIENELIKNSAKFGMDVLDRSVKMHGIVDKFITNNSYWKAAKRAEKKVLEKNKVLKDYEHPNKEHSDHLKFRNYIENNTRIKKLQTVVDYSQKEADLPSLKTFASMGVFCMEEGVIVAGKNLTKHL